MALELTQPLTAKSARKCFWGVECGRRLRLATQQPSDSTDSEITVFKVSNFIPILIFHRVCPHLTWQLELLQVQR
jgi:hypothetical protein